MQFAFNSSSALFSGAHCVGPMAVRQPFRLHIRRPCGCHSNAWATLFPLNALTNLLLFRLDICLVEVFASQTHFLGHFIAHNDFVFVSSRRHARLPFCFQRPICGAFSCAFLCFRLLFSCVWLLETVVSILRRNKKYKTQLRHLSELRFGGCPILPSQCLGSFFDGLACLAHINHRMPFGNPLVLLTLELRMQAKLPVVVMSTIDQRKFSTLLFPGFDAACSICISKCNQIVNKLAQALFWRLVSSGIHDNWRALAELPSIFS